MSKWYLIILTLIISLTNVSCRNKSVNKAQSYFLCFNNGFENDEVAIYYDGVFQRKVILTTWPQLGAAKCADSLCLVPENIKTIDLYLPKLNIRSKYLIIQNENKAIGVWLDKDNKKFAFKQKAYFEYR